MDLHTIKIYGASDDLVEVEGDARGCDEYNTEFALFRLVAGGSQSRVWVKYISPGVWSIAVAPADEGIPMVPVKISSGSNEYTALAEAEVDSVIREYTE